MEATNRKDSPTIDASKLCPVTEFNEFKHATVLFYSQRTDGLYILLFSTNSDDKSLSVPSAAYEGYDSAITFTATRAIVSQTKGVLSPNILKKIAEGQAITKDDLIFPEDMPIPKLWANEHYQAWLRTVTDCGCFHDELQGHIFYFLDVGALNIDDLNANLLKIDLPLHFKWVKVEDLSQQQISSPLKEFIKTVDIAAHLKEKQTYDSLPLSRQNIYVFLMCKPDSTQSEFDYFYDHLPALYVGIFKRNLETWLIYNSAKDEFPSDEVMKAAKGVIIPGSPSSAHKEEPWLLKTWEWLRTFDKEYPKTKFLGVCFGEQIICHSIGGKSDHMQERKDNPKFFITKVEEVDVFPEFFDLKFMKKNVGIVPNKLRVVEAHGDEVSVLPPGFIHYGGSKSCKIELLASKDERYFGIQGHPEFALQYFAARGTVYYAFLEKQPLTREYFEENYRKRLEGQASDEHLTRKICYDFIKSPIQDA